MTPLMALWFLVLIFTAAVTPFLMLAGML